MSGGAVIFESERPRSESYLGVLEGEAGQLILEVRSPAYRNAEYHMSPEERADFAEAILRSLDDTTRESVIGSVTGVRGR